ncbi:MAG: methyltransferase domain-containing protein [Candidatus Hydrogenedens sp.]|nr:methyltransferase domain-containing protein [Candidatus Hydrogenedens sp.]
MGFDYDAAAPGYDNYRTGSGPYFEQLLTLAAESPAGPVLEFGAGTGNNTREFLQAHPRPFVALERSAGMLAQGAAKVPGVRWTRGCATHMPFRDSTFAYIFSTYVLHHIADIGQLYHECLRVLKPGGCCACITVPETFILEHPMNAYFPSFAEVDLRRFQPIDEVEDAMRAAGFRRVESVITVSRPRPIDADFVEKVANQYISTYALLPRDEFERGVERLRADVQRLGQLPEPFEREAAVVWGFKPRG